MRMYVLKSGVNELINKPLYIFLQLKMVYVVPNERVFLETHYFYHSLCLQKQNNFIKGNWWYYHCGKKNFCLKFIHYRKPSHHAAQINNNS